MFSYEEIQKYSETDIQIYKYIVSNIDKVQFMTIRSVHCIRRVCFMEVQYPHPLALRL